MSEDSFNVNVDQYSLVPDEKDSIKHIYIVYLSCMYKFQRGEKRPNLQLMPLEYMKTCIYTHMQRI